MNLSLSGSPQILTSPSRDVSFISTPTEKQLVNSTFKAISTVCASVVMAIGFLGLLTWAIPGLSFLPHSRWISILVYPETAFAFLLLGTALYLYVQTSWNSRVHSVVSLMGGIAGIITIMDMQSWGTAVSPPMNHFFLKYLQSAQIAYQPSFWITTSLFGLSLCILFLPLAGTYTHRRLADGVGYGASVLLLANAAILLSYFYGTPLFHESTWSLPCLTSIIASTALSTGIITGMGSRQFPLRALVGPSVRARLLRTFLPVAASAVLIHSILQNTIFGLMNPVVSVTLTAFVSMAIAGFLVIRSSQIVSLQIERAVRESEERFSILVDSLEDYAIFMLDPEGHVMTWNAGAERIIGYRAEGILGEHFACFYPPDEIMKGNPSKSLKQALQYGSYTDQGWRIRDDGTHFWADVTLTPLLDESKCLRGYSQITRDITERKRAEEALRQKTNFVHMLQTVSSAANESSSMEDAIQICLGKVCQQMGWPIGHSVIVSPSTGLLESASWFFEEGPLNLFRDDKTRKEFEQNDKLAERVLISGTSVWVRDIMEDAVRMRWHPADAAGLRGAYAFPVKVGSEVVAVLEFFSATLADPNGPLLDVMEHIGTQLGRVVERSRADAALRESEMRFRSVAQSANDAIISCNAYGLIVAWNKGARAIFGYREEEMLGNALTLIVPECMQLLNKNQPHSAFERTVEMSALTKTGEHIPIELSAADWKIGEDVFFTAIIRDIYKRKESEAHINASLREKEVLLKEIHHRVKNNLQIISSLLRLQSQHVTDEKTLDMFRESQNRVKSMALIHEYLYQTRDMARINFSDYLRNLISHLFRSYGITPDRVKLDLHVDETPLDLDTAIPCGLVVTELVSNALKHAFPDKRQGVLNVSFHAFPEVHQFELMVKDNGIGLPLEFRLDENRTSLGLRLITTLTHQLQGQIYVDGKQGTEIKIRFKA